MSVEIVKIVQTTEGEMAYILRDGRLLKVWVEDMTGGSVDDFEEVRSVPQPKRQARRAPPPVPLEEIEEAAAQLDEPAPAPAPRGRNPKQKSIIPPHLRGVFVRPGNPGADVERREV